MTEAKTKAQNRLKKLQETLKESRKNPKNPVSSRRNQLLTTELHKMTNPKSSNVYSRPVFSPGREKQLKILDSFLEKTANRLSKSFFPPRTVNNNYDSPRKYESSTVKKSSIDYGVSSSDKREKYLQSTTFNTRLHVGPAPRLLRKPNQIDGISGSERCSFIPQPPTEKRKSDHENGAKKKVFKTQTSEDSSRNKIISKSKHEMNKFNDGRPCKMKLPSVPDSHNDDSPSKEVTKQEKLKASSSQDYQFKEPAKNNPLENKNITVGPLSKRGVVKKSSLGKERKFKGKEEIKQLLITSAPTTKMQARLQKVVNDMKQQKKKDPDKESKSNENTELVNDSSNSQCTESMDWEASNDEILRSIRNEVDPTVELMEWQDISCMKTQPCEESSLHIVVDTNVLLRNIGLIKRLSKATIRGFKINLMIPWQVLKELDNLKNKVNHNNASMSARKAIHFLAEATNNDKLNVAFQTQAQHFQECPSQFVVEVPDDHLIKCCYQFRNKNQEVMLLSNDVNLRVKTVTNNIQAVDDKWMSNILEQQFISEKEEFHCFEKDTKEHQSDDIKNNCCCLIYKVTKVLLTYLSNIVAAKYKEKYGNLWPLWVPTGLHLSEILNYITSSASFEPYWGDLNLIKKFYRQHKSYDDIKAVEIEWLGRKCISLVRSMYSFNFISCDVAVQFFKDMSFLKTPADVNPNDVTYIEGSYRLAEKYFKDTEDSLNETYLNELYQGKGSLLKGNTDVLHHIDVNLELINQFRSAIVKFQEIQEEVPVDCEVAKTLHEAICSFLGRERHDTKFPIFSPHDVVEYVNHNRNFFNPAVIWLTNQELSLKVIQSRIL